MTRNIEQKGSLTDAFDGLYSGKKVLVTGHTGFKGSWLSLWLQMLGADVTGYSLPPPTEPSHFHLIGGAQGIRDVRASICDNVKLEETFRKVKPEIVFHLAAQAVVRDAYADPKGTFDTNIGGTVNVLEAARHTPTVRAVVIVTSDKCYENHEWPWGYRENDPVGGSDPYSASKGATELVCSAYWRSFFKSDRNRSIGLSTARAGNVIGGGDWARDRIIPDCVRHLSAQKPLVLRNPESVRPWQHVLDALSGYLMLGSRLLKDHKHFSGPWNFGPHGGRDITVREIAQRFTSVWPGSLTTVEHSDNNGPKEASSLRLSIEKAVKHLDWLPLLDISSAVEWTIDWYKEWSKADGEMRRVSQKQIEKYMGLSAERKMNAAAPSSMTGTVAYRLSQKR